MKKQTSYFLAKAQYCPYTVNGSKMAFFTTETTEVFTEYTEIRSLHVVVLPAAINVPGCSCVPTSPCGKKSLTARFAKNRKEKKHFLVSGNIIFAYAALCA